jgi:hypothetical protein
VGVSCGWLRFRASSSSQDGRSATDDQAYFSATMVLGRASTKTFPMMRPT